MLRVKAYNNGNKTLLYSVETYRLGPDKFFAVTSDEMKRVVIGSSGEHISMVRPLSEGKTRQEAIDNLQTGIKVMCGVEIENQSFIAVRHHDVWGCYYCKYFPKYENYEEWSQHIKDVHSQPMTPFGIPSIKLPHP